VSADIVTAAGAGIADGAIYAIDPRDTFSSGPGFVYAVFRVHNLPARARVGARWIFPGGRVIPYVCPVALCPPHRLASATYTYYVAQTLAGPGRYAVSALINGRAVGLHHFTVKATGTAPAPRGQSTTPVAPPATGLSVYAANPVGKPSRSHHGPAQPPHASLLLSATHSQPPGGDDHGPAKRQRDHRHGRDKGGDNAGDGVTIG
jgi:hypothetical protein